MRPKPRCKSMALRVPGLALLAVCLAETVQAQWFTTREQEARTYFEQGHYDVAADLFEDPYRKGVALYRAGRYQKASRAFSAVERAEVSLQATYNLGNALFQQGEYEAAIEAYERVMDQDPDHQDAWHNLQLARQRITLLRETPPKEPQLPEEREESPEPDEPEGSRQQESQRQDSQTQSQDQAGEQSGDQSGGEGSEQQSGESGQQSDQASGGTGDEQAGASSRDEAAGGEASGVEQKVADQAGERGDKRRGDASDADEASGGAEQHGGGSSEDQGWGSLFGQFPDPWSEQEEEANKAPGAEERRPDVDEPTPERALEHLATMGALHDDDAREDRPHDTPASQAVAEVDQMQHTSDVAPGQERPSEFGFPEAPAEWPHAAIPVEWLMEQWLQQVDKGPGRLLRNQFLVEERRAAEALDGSFVEPRPW